MLLQKDQHNNEVLCQYLSGDDLNSHPDQIPGRWIINFRDWPYNLQSAPQGYSGPTASDYPECLEILIKRVKPQRDTIVARGKQIHEYDFWKFWDRRDNFYAAIKPMDRFIAATRVTKYCISSFTGTDIIASEQVIAFSIDRNAMFSILQSAFHDSWAWKNSSTMGGTTLRYGPSDVFETFPFPSAFTHSSSTLESTEF